MTDMHANRSQPPEGKGLQAASLVRDIQGHAPTGVGLSMPDRSYFRPAVIIGMTTYPSVLRQAGAWHGCTHSGEYPIVLYDLNGQTHSDHFKSRFYGSTH